MSLILQFGKHKGEHVDKVPAQYLLWAFVNVWKLDPEIKEYIRKNMKALESMKKVEDEEYLSECDATEFDLY